MVRTALIAAALAVGLSGCNTAYNYFEEEPEQKGQVQNSTAFGALLTMGGGPQQQRQCQCCQHLAHWYMCVCL